MSWPDTRRRVILESPYAGNVSRNRAYARLAMHDSLMRSEAPFLSHALYTQVLDDTDEAQRYRGMTAGQAWYEVAHAVVSYQDLGVSGGMKAGIALADKLGLPVEVRLLWPGRDVTGCHPLMFRDELRRRKSTLVVQYPGTDWGEMWK